MKGAKGNEGNALCEHGTIKMVTLCKPRDSGRITVPVDSCIADDVQRLNNLGIITLGSCCGHGNGNPHVLIDEKSVALIRTIGYEPFLYVYADGESHGVYEARLKMKEGQSHELDGRNYQNA